MTVGASLGGCDGWPPRTPIGTFGSVNVRRRGNRVTAETRVRDADGQLRRVTTSASSAAAARRQLMGKLLARPGRGNGGVLQASSSFVELAELWHADLELRDLAEGTRQVYRDQLRLHVHPAFEHYTLGEITTGRVEWFLKSQAAVSQSRANQSRTLLNLMFAFALRHDAISRNPVEGTSPLRKRKSVPQALTLEQIASRQTMGWRFATVEDREAVVGLIVENGATWSELPSRMRRFEACTPDSAKPPHRPAWRTCVEA